MPTLSKWSAFSYAGGKKTVLVGTVTGREDTKDGAVIRTSLVLEHDDDVAYTLSTRYTLINRDDSSENRLSLMFQHPLFFAKREIEV